MVDLPFHHDVNFAEHIGTNTVMRYVTCTLAHAPCIFDITVISVMFGCVPPENKQGTRDLRSHGLFLFVFFL